MSKKQTWERTTVQHLLRNGKSGRYYGRWTISGKQIWRKLDTDVLTVAKLRLADEVKKIELLRGSNQSVASGRGTVGDLIRIYEKRVKALTNIKPSSIDSRITALKKVIKTWPDLEQMKPRQVTPAAVWEWARRFKSEGTQFTPPGSKTVRVGNSASSVNRAVDALRRVMEIAVNQGTVHENPVGVRPPEEEGHLKKKIESKKLVLPSSIDFQRILTAMENNGARGGWGMETADFCRFLAYSGARVGEVQKVSWECVDWERNVVRIAGTKSETSNREVPLFPALADLLAKIIERRKRAAIYAVGGKPMIASTDRVLRLSECQKTIDTACKTTGIERFTHHDLRHLFATKCIESGVDIPTVSRWMGHSDGGALAMKTYGHLRQEHSQTQAAKVSFGTSEVQRG